jgi:hypothetical protein
VGARRGAIVTTPGGLPERDGYVSDISLALRYRPELFGRPFGELLQQVMKGPSEWTEGERELFAAFVSVRPTQSAQNRTPSPA